MSLPTETCQECHKTITKRAIANVFGDRVVCTACWRRLTREKEAAEEAERAARAPATPRQIAYARDLGVQFAPDITSQLLSALITARLDRPGTPELQREAAMLGVPDVATTPGRKLKEKVDERQMLSRWVYSVCRHMLGADWLLFADSRLPLAAIVPVVAELASREENVDAVAEQYEGLSSNEFDDACDARGIQEGDSWYFFVRDGASSRAWIYTTTQALICRHLGACLAQLPVRVNQPARRR